MIHINKQDAGWLLPTVCQVAAKVQCKRGLPDTTFEVDYRDSLRH
jgi:hypothetical protein